MSVFETPRFSKLLVCTDNSPSSPGVIKAGLEVGRLTSAELRLLDGGDVSLVPRPVTHRH